MNANLNFNNHQIIPLIHGEIPHTSQTIKEAFINPQDRKIFTLWAQSRLSVVEKSKTLETIYGEVLQLNIDSEYEDDPISLKAFSIGKALVNTGTFIFSFIKPKDKTDDLDALAKKIQKNNFNPNSLTKKELQNISVGRRIDLRVILINITRRSVLRPTEK